MLKKILSILRLLVILIAASIGREIGKQTGKDDFSPSKPSVHELNEALIRGLTKGAEQANRRGPFMVDK